MMMTATATTMTMERICRYRAKYVKSVLDSVWFCFAFLCSKSNCCRTVFRIYFNTVFICSMLFQLANECQALHKFCAMRSNLGRLVCVCVWIERLRVKSVRVWRVCGRKFAGENLLVLNFIICGCLSKCARVCHSLVMLHLSRCMQHLLAFLLLLLLFVLFFVIHRLGLCKPF